MKKYKAIILFAFVSSILLIGCDSGKKHSNFDEYTEENEDLLPFGATDTIDGEKVSTECALVNFDFESLQRRVDNVKSPDMLMTLKVDFMHTLDSLTLNSKQLPSDEQAKINTIRETLLASYNKACRDYEIPADGVISNLKICLERVNKADSRQALVRFTEVRRGMLHNLENIHLCVESKSTRINEVKRLASQLREELNRKARHYDVKY